MTIESKTQRFCRTATLAAVVAATLNPAAAWAQTRSEVPAPVANLPSGTSPAVWAGSTLYVSGSLDPDIKAHHDTESQTVGVLNFLKKLLESQNLTMGDVVMLHVYLGADPAKGGKRTSLSGAWLSR